MLKAFLRFGVPAVGGTAMMGSSGMAIKASVENIKIKSRPKATRKFWKEFLNIKSGSELKDEPWFICVHKNDDNRAILYRKSATSGEEDKLNLRDNPDCKNTDKNPLKGKNFQDWIDGKLDTSTPANDPLLAAN